MAPRRDWSLLRERIIGLGEESARKSFYPELQHRLQQLEETRESLRISQQNLWSVFNSFHDAVVIHDRQGRILEANQPAAAMFGTSLENLLSLTVLDVSCQDQAQGEARAQFRELMAAMDRQGFMVREWRAQRVADGACVDVEVAVKPAIWYGAPAVAAVVRDITERKTQESLVRQAQKLESLGQLAGGLAHDTNNMLGVIIGFSELLREELPPGNEALQGHVDQILQAAKRSADLIRQLLAFARKQTIQPRRVDLNRLVEETQRMLRHLIGSGHALVWKPATSLWPVWLDPSQMSQVLVNLVVNARDAMDTAGTITLATANQVVDEAYAQSHPESLPGDYVVLAVTDSGQGMEPAVLGHIFEPFFTTKEVGKGSGLGLAMVYGILRQNGGFVTVYSAPGAGTTFRLHLPRLQDPRGEEAAPGPEASAPGGTETVLLVDDEPALLELGRAMLESAGYRVLAAAGPGEALERAAREPGEIHLLATDLAMPGMNGASLCREVRKLRPRIRRLLMSGHPQDAGGSRDRVDNDVMFLQKPFTRRALLLMVREALG